MKLRRILPVAIIGTGLFAVTVASQGCSSSSSSTTTASAGTVPPAAPAGAAAATTGTPRTFALQQLFLGGNKRDGSPSDTAWKDYGYNIDGKITTATSTDVCKLAAGAQKSSQADGTGGTDNSFGENILPIITSVSPTAEADISKSITDGSFTIMIQVQGLGDDPAQNNIGLSGQIFAGGAYDPNKAVPAFDINTDWPVRPELLVDGKTIAGGSKVQFSPGTTYITGGQFVTQASKISLALAIGGVGLTLDINKAVITFKHTSANTADVGTIAGVIDTEQLISGLKTVAGRIQKSLCTGSAFEQIAGEIRQASDIMTDGTNTPGASCTGISIGLGFIAKEIKNPDKVADLGVPSPDPCTVSDAGTD